MKKVSFLACLLSVLPLSLSAMDSDREQPIHVEADQLELREKEGISIYQGNVKLVQGSLEIESDRLVIHFDADNNLALMEMTGKLATFRQLDNDQQPLYGEAEQIDYDESRGLLIMRRSAYLDRAGDDIRSELIRFNTTTNGIEAGGEQSNDRVKMVIKPRSPENGDDATGDGSGASGQ